MLAVINIRDKQFEYYDSMWEDTKDPMPWGVRQILRTLRRWLNIN